MDQWRKDARKEPIIIDIDLLVPADHLLRKIEKVIDYEWLYERMLPWNLKNWQIGVVITLIWLKYYLFFVPDMPKPQFSLNENWGSLTD